jgi:hypothetical protein
MVSDFSVRLPRKPVRRAWIKPSLGFIEAEEASYPPSPIPFTLERLYGPSKCEMHSRQKTTEKG